MTGPRVDRMKKPPLQRTSTQQNKIIQIEHNNDYISSCIVGSRSEMFAC